MRLLLDTHILLWWLNDDPQLPSEAAKLIADRGNQVSASSMSVWEMAIKIGLGRLEADIHEVLAAAQESGFRPLPFTVEHAAAVAHLPPYHRDPFDRALVAQAVLEPLKLLTHDGTLAVYGDHVLLV